MPIIDGVQQLEEDNSLRELLGNFLTNVALSSQVEGPNGETKEGEVAKPLEQITISTIHAAKGSAHVYR